MRGRWPTNTHGNCQCGCGKTTTVSSVNRHAYGIVKGEHVAFIPGHGRRNGPQYIVDETTGCWVWNLNTSAKGYGIMRVGDKPSAKAHRHFYEQRFGPISEGLQIDHLCRNRACVNPEHMEPVEAYVNSVVRGLDHNANKSHCPHGHAYDEANTLRIRRSDGGIARVCRACNSARRRKRYLSTGK